MTRIGSVCSGYGGLDAAVAAVFGGSVSWFVEFAAGPARLLAHHWPGTPNLHDVTTVNWSEVDAVDLLAGGYSCQPFSLAGRRKGAADERHVWPFLARGEVDLATGQTERPGALAALRPRLAVFENVAGHLSLGFDVVLADLHELGYDAWWTLWNASDEGAPHRRRRLFVLAVRRDRAVPVPRDGVLVARREDGWTGPDEGLFGAVPFTGPIPQAGAQIGGGMYALPDPTPSRTATSTVLLGTPRCADGVEHRLRSEVGNPRGRLEDQIAKLLPTPTARDDKGAGYGDPPGRPLSEAVHALLPTHRAAATRTSRGAALRADSMSSPSLDQATELAHGVVPREFADAEEMPRSWKAALLPTPTATPYGNNQSDSPGAAVRPSLDTLASSVQASWGVYGPAIRRWEQVSGRVAPPPTMTGARGGQQLSPAFVEWMMGLPAGHVTAVPDLSRAEQLKLLGNGVCPPQASAALRWLADAAAVSAGRAAA